MKFSDSNDFGFEMYMDAMRDMFEFHNGQLDKSGNPYYLHPMRVASHFQELGMADMATVACLHDLVEDTKCSLGYIEDRYPEEIVDAVDAISRRDGETYKQYIRRCIKNPIACAVKKQDVLDNLRPERVWKNAPLSRYFWALGAIEAKERGIEGEF